MEKPLKESQRLREKPKPLPATPTTPIEKRVVTRGAEAVTDTLDRKAGAQVRPPVQAQEKIQAPSAGAVARDAQESEAEAQKPTFKMATREKARHISVTLTVRDAAQAARETENLLNQLGAQKIKRELIENTQIITAELQAQKVEELSEKLRTIGAIKERDSFQQIPEGDVPVRIEITRAP